MKLKLKEVITKEFIKSIYPLEYEELYEDIIKGYTPSFVKTFDIKTDTKTRSVSVENEKDKKIEKILYTALKPFSSCVSDNNYAFIENRSIFDAIYKTSLLTKKYNVYLKTDIKNFFNSIDHRILTKMLLKYLDEDFVKVLMLFFKNRFIKNNEYNFHDTGIHQGSVISPFLSNFYITPFDRFLEKRCEYVRFADDIIIFTQNPDKLLKDIKRFLNVLKLELNSEKTYITSKSFVFLNIRFKKDSFFLENEKFNSLLSKVVHIKKNDVENVLNSIKAYYLKVLNEKQLNILKESLIRSFAKNDMVMEIDFLNISKKDILKQKEIIKLQKLEKEVDKILNKQLNIFSKEELNSVIFIHSSGIRLGISKNSVTLKKKGKLIKKFPLNSVKKIIIAAKGISISSNLIYHATNRGISIDFIFNNTPYAEIVTLNPKTHHMLIKQISILNTSKHLQLAKAFVSGKVKNQINYLKYLSKYHKFLKEDIKKFSKNIKNVKSIEELRGYEGEVANIYWSAIAKVLDFEIPGRVTKGATDVFNSTLNYAYAILYSRVQNALIKAGLNIYVSYLHSFQDNKPTLVYDLIEEFRAFAVDRVVVSMFNRNEKIEVIAGELTKSSKKLVLDNIIEKLASFTTYKKEKVKIENIILKQAYLLRKAIEENVKYKPFIGRY